jgi:hypothetical protein
MIGARAGLKSREIVHTDQDEMIQTASNGRARTESSGESTRAPPYRYRAYSLVIHSDLVLPELEPDAAERPDIVIRLQPTGRPLPSPAQGYICEYGSDIQYLAWPGVGAFVIRGVGEIDIEPAPGAGRPLLNFPLLGPVMALLLHLRGMFVLHASAVDVAGGSAVFLGAKGAGKSTIAAALVAAGHRLLTDDVLAIDFSESNGPRIVPGFPQLKLCEDAADKVVLKEAFSMAPPIPDFPKRQRRLTSPFLHSYAPLNCVYVLTREPVATTRELSAEDALTALIRFSLLPLYRQRPLSGAEASTHLKRCAALVGSVRVSALGVPSDFDRLEEVVRLVESDLS